MSLNPKQSSEKSNRRLKAQRQLYSEAKGWWIADFFLTVVITVLISIIRVFAADIDLSLLAGCWALLATFLSFVVFTPIYRRKQSEAAGIQELFDCDVLGIPASPMIKCPPEDKMVELSNHYDREGKSEGTLKDWYPVTLDNLPEGAATAICQRINSRWDEKLRTRYLHVLGWTTGAFVLVVVVTSLALDLTLKGLIMSTLLPLLKLAVFQLLLAIYI